MWDKLREQLKQFGIERELEAELRSGIALQERIAQAEQVKIAQANRRLPRRGVEGLGQTTMSMHPFYRALADIRFGKGWMKDRAARRKLLQEHPEFAVSYLRKATVQVLKPEVRDQKPEVRTDSSPAPLTSDHRLLTSSSK